MLDGEHTKMALEVDCDVEVKANKEEEVIITQEKKEEKAYDNLKKR